MGGTLDLTRKLLEMELRRRVEPLHLPSFKLEGPSLEPEDVDELVAHLLPFIENQIKLAKEGQR